MNINVKQTLSGSLLGNLVLTGDFKNASELTGRVNVGGLGGGVLDRYEGEYEVIPKTIAQILDTRQKFLSEDVLIEEIPYAEVSNNANGITATIADPNSSGDPSEPGSSKVTVTDDGNGNLVFTGVFVKNDINGNITIGDE